MTEPAGSGGDGGAAASIGAQVQRLVDLVAVQFGALAMLWVLDTDGRTLVPFVAGAEDSELHDGLLTLMSAGSPAMGQGMAGRVADSRAPVLIPVVSPDDIGRTYPPYGDFMRRHAVHSIALVPLIDADTVVGVVGVARHADQPSLDTDDQRRLLETAEVGAPLVASARTATSLRYYRDLVDSVSDSIVATDANWRVTAWNPAAERLYGRSASESLGRTIREVAGGDWLSVDDGTGRWVEQSREASMEQLTGAGEWRGRARHYRADGEAILVEGRVTALRDLQGRITGYVAVNRDVTDLVAAERERERSRLLAQTVLDASPALNVVVDPDGRVAAANTAWYRTLGELGHEEEQADLRAWMCLAVNAAPVLAVVEDVLSGRRDAADLELEFTDPREQPMWLAGQIVALSGDVGAVLALMDTTSRRNLERQLAHRAQHDPLTGLPNRSALMVGLSRALARAERTGSHVAVLFCDLDRFKDVNDSLGHEQGDLALREAAHRIVAAVRSHETVARFGGDEFVVVIEDVDTAEDVLPVADRILRAMWAPIALGPHEVSVGVSVGIAVSSGHGVEGEAERLLSEADIAMYEAKDEGRNRAVTFHPDMRDRIHTRLALAAGLRHAVENDELELVYQPVARVDDDAVIAVETFVRWRHPGRGLLVPDAFLEAAEESGAIVGVGEWVLDRAVAQLAAWSDRLDPRVSLDVNMSPRQLADPELVLTIAETLDRHGVDPGRLVLEFTETALLDDPESAVATLGRLATLGVGLAIDDFGTGLSSLARLEEVPLRTLKVDRLLASRADRDPRARALVRAVTSLGHALGLSVVAEGVETVGQRSAVADAGCDAYQGYLLSRPVPAADLTAFLDR